MKPPVFDYTAPDSVEGALATLAEHGYDAKILAGGQSLVPVLNFRLAQPALLVDLNRLTELDYLRVDPDGTLRIGGMTRQRTVEQSTEVARHAPLLAQTMPHVAHPQIRNRGTVGGSLAHADPSAELPVVAVALDAEIKLRSQAGERSVSAEEFFVGLMTTELRPDEILVEMTIPARPPRTGSSFLEIARRHGDYAQSGVAAMVSLADDDSVSDVRLVFLSGGDVPIRAKRAEDILRGGLLNEEKVLAAAQVASREEIEPSGDIHATAEFKRHLAGVLTRRALEQARQRALGASDAPGGPV